MASLTAILNRPGAATVLVLAAIGVSSYGVAHYPRSVVAFLLFQGSILLLYFARLGSLAETRPGRPDLGRADADPRHDQRLLSGSRHPGGHLRGAGPGTQHRRGSRRAPGPGLCGLLRRGRLHVGHLRVAPGSEVHLRLGRVVSARGRLVFRVPDPCRGGGGGRGGPLGAPRAPAARRLPGRRHAGLRRGDPSAGQQPGQAHQPHQRSAGDHADRRARPCSSVPFWNCSVSTPPRLLSTRCTSISWCCASSLWSSSSTGGWRIPTSDAPGRRSERTRWRRRPWACRWFG